MRSRLRVVLWMLGLLAFVCVLTFVAQGAGQAFGGGVLAYMGQRTTGGDILWRLYYLDVRRGLTVEVNEGADSSRSDPVWSPDGSQVAYLQRDADDNNDIFIMAMNGGDARNITHGDSSEGWLDWSPDGRRILFYNRTNEDLYTINADGTNRTRITHNDHIEASAKWSPDGASLLYTSQLDDNLYQITLANAAGGDLRFPYPHPYAQYGGDWSPDGRQIVYLQNDGTARFDLLVQDVPPSGTPTEYGGNLRVYVGSDPDWSPDGRYIALSAPGSGEFPDLFVIDLRTGSTRQLTNTPRVIERSPDWRRR